MPSIREITTDGNMFDGIDPTTLRLGDDDEFVTGPYDPSLDDVDSSSVLRATRKALQKPDFSHKGRAVADEVLRTLNDTAEPAYPDNLRLADASRAEAASPVIGRLLRRQLAFWQRRGN